MVGVLLSLAAIGGAASLWTARRRHSRRRAHEWHAWVRGTLRAVRDAAITTDIDGRVMSMNIGAECLTGWREADAIGRPLCGVFRLIDEETRRPVVNPVLKAIYKQAVVGPSPRTILVSKDGSEHRILERAAPISDDRGCLCGCMLVFALARE